MVHVPAAGNLIPGIARKVLHVALDWAPVLGWRAGIEAHTLDRVYVNDVNSDAAAGYGVLSAHAGYLARWRGVDLSGFARIDNIFDHRYAGSVIVNEGNARYFEPAPGRNWTVGAAATVAF